LKHRKLNAGRFALSGLAIATACLWGLNAQALGLGRLTVLSALGETLRAEIEVTSLSADEAASLQLRIASPDAYRAAGVEYNPALPSATVQVVRRPDGRSVLRVTSDRAVLEPFVDVIIGVVAKLQGLEATSLKDWYDLPRGVLRLESRPGQVVVIY